ncbi:MAG: hypothetical protein BWK78_01095 [Thiotrichaceae bacterium IS1]|nr:MAG: hypothetical protein BWK78_01095 [Thiotrichaceae bacterium IS1]
MSTLLKLIALFCLLTAAATAADAPTDPILRIETGMHTAPMRGISVDAAERFLVTASDDKTLRLWNLATGELLTTYYIPIGTTPEEGQLYSGAISPDGEWVVGAGWTGYEWDNQFSIYLFHRADGKLVRRLSGLEDVIDHLCFSPDGQYLGATLGGGRGVRIWHTQTWQLIFADRKYEDSSYWCDFDQQNRMVTTSWDGYLRLYAPQGEGFALVTPPVEAPGGKQPFAAVFSPNGDKIAVGFDNSTNVNVLDGKTLALLYAPDTTGIDNGDLGNVAWSLDGNNLYAGGSYGNDSGIVVLQWPQAGQGTPYTVWQASLLSLLSAIADLRPLSNGRIVYGDLFPAFGVLDSMGKKFIEKISTIVSYGGVYQDNFGISQDGSIISFWSARFSLLEQTLIIDLSPEAKTTLNANLTPPDMTSLNNITEWEDSDTPKFNGTFLPLREYEISSSLAIAPDHSKFLLGTNWNLHLFDANGQQLWEVSIPIEAWGVNISGDGKKAVAALGDGTIRWYNLENGQELLALFIQEGDGTGDDTTTAQVADNYWIAWMPSGYYMSSSDQADSLIGWHVNNGKDKEASFYPAGALYASYKRPDVVKKILVTLNAEEAIQQANAEANYQVDTPASTRAALGGVASRYDVNPDLTNQGRAIIIAAGGEQDSNKLYPYTNTAAQEMYRFLHDQGFSDGDIVYMNPTSPIVPANGYRNGTRQDFPVFDPPTELEQAFAQVTQCSPGQKCLEAGQQFILYVHGHARPDNIRMNPKAELSAQQLKDFLAKIPAGVQQIIILDTCYSGSFLDDLAGVPNRVVITSSDGSSQAWTADKGSFSDYLMEYLQQASSVGEAFELARCDVISAPDIFGSQQPQLDDTQDGIYTAKDCPNSIAAGKGSESEGQDGPVASQVYLGGKKTHQASPPEIIEVHSPIRLTADQTTTTLWVKAVPDFNGMKTVRAILLNELDTTTTYQGEETQATRRELTLKPNYQTQRYEATYDQFHTATRWKILYQAQSMEGVWSAISIGYAVAPNVALPFQVEVNLNQAIYHQGDQMQFNLLTKGEGQVDLYAGIIFPMDFFYQTVIDDSPLSLSLPNTLQPYQTYLRLRGQQTVSVFNITSLPILPPGQYKACGLLANHSDPLKTEDWLSFQCQEFQVE